VLSSGVYIHANSESQACQPPEKVDHKCYGLDQRPNYY